MKSFDVTQALIRIIQGKKITEYNWLSDQYIHQVGNEICDEKGEKFDIVDYMAQCELLSEDPDFFEWKN